MNTESSSTYQVTIYIAGPIETAKQALRAECMREGLCVTIEPTHYIYTGAEEAGYKVGLLNYPRFPAEPASIFARARLIAEMLLKETYQHSCLIVAPDVSEWLSVREDQ